MGQASQIKLFEVHDRSSLSFTQAGETACRDPLRWLAEFCIAKATHQVIVDHADGLHERVTDR
jgi:hypothetical protein